MLAQVLRSQWCMLQEASIYRSIGSTQQHFRAAHCNLRTDIETISPRQVLGNHGTFRTPSRRLFGRDQTTRARSQRNQIVHETAAAATTIVGICIGRDGVASRMHFIQQDGIVFIEWPNSQLLLCLRLQSSIVRNPKRRGRRRRSGHCSTGRIHATGTCTSSVHVAVVQVQDLVQGRRCELGDIGTKGSMFVLGATRERQPMEMCMNVGRAARQQEYRLPTMKE
jgi:hypothetical protein